MEKVRRSLSAVENSKERNSRLTPPVSPTPFMLAFAAAEPPVSSVPAYSNKSVMRERWDRVFNLSPPLPISTTTSKYRDIRRWLVLAALPTALILLVATAATISWNNIHPSSGGSGRRLVLTEVSSSEWRRGLDQIDPADLLERDSSPDDADVPVLSIGGLNPDSSSSSTTSPSPTTSLSFNLSGSNSDTTTPTTTRATIAPSVPASPVLPTPFVQPFDETLSTDFISGNCQNFFTNLTQSLDFRQCRPFSLLLPTSQAFLTAQNNLTLLTAIVYGTCNTTPSEDDCVARMNEYQNDIQDQCSAELQAGHALTWDALNGFKNYEMYRKGACLQNMRTNSYCFVDAVAASPPSDIYFYQLPLGTPLPGTSTSSANSASATTGNGVDTGITITPGCTPCTQSLMAVWASYATNSSLLISSSYPSAQKAVDKTCGTGYASAISAGRRSAPIIGLGAWIFSVVVAIVILWLMV